MADLPLKCVIDTNVPIVANFAKDPLSIPDDLVECVDACINAIKHITSQKGHLVMDDGDEIFDEYRRNDLSLSGQSGQGDTFLKWVHTHRWNSAFADRVKITKDEESYTEFPDHEGLKNFDISDRKFVAVANAHPEKPPILQATDCKWLGWSNSLAETGITVNFLCPDYVEKKYQKKIGHDEE